MKQFFLRWHSAGMRATMVLILLVSILQQNWMFAGMSLLALIFAIFPVIINLKNSNSIPNSLQNIKNQISQFSEQSTQIYRSSDSLLRIATSQSSAVTESSAALDEIASMVSKTNENSVHLGESVKISKESSTQGLAVLDDIKNSMEEIQVSIAVLEGGAQSNLESLDKIIIRFKEITAKSNLIKDIAMQSKLLSFNASVEAARAGEHGKGFAVVAEEMGNLAKTSGSAANEIDAILSAGSIETQNIIQKLSTDLKKQISETSMKAYEGLGKAAEAEYAIKQIFESVQNVETKTQEILNASQEQDIGVREISKAIHEVKNLSDQLQTESEAINGVALNLSESSGSSLSLIGGLYNLLNVKNSDLSIKFDFKSAIKAHIDWKMKLDIYLKNIDHSLKEEAVSSDSLCILGQWLYGDGLKYSDLNEYKVLVDAHKKFHEIAGNIIHFANEGSKEKAFSLLAPGGTFLDASDRCVHCIERLQKAV